MPRRFAVLALLAIAVSGWMLAADHDATVKIMTQNMDDGTDQTYVVAALTNAVPLSLPEAVDLTFLELQASNFPLRAGLLAEKIAVAKPDLVALQEASLWRSTSPTTGVTTVLADQLALLLSALKAAGTPYDVVAVNNVNDTTLPGQNVVAALQFIDRNALLIRSGLRPPAFHVSEVHSHIFDASFVFSGLQVHSGWISAKVHMGNKQFRLVTTHLLSPIPGVAQATEIQVAQAGELIHALRNSTLPVVLCGDFNSDANGGNFLDSTPTAGLIQTAGYPEVWPLIHPGDPGFTWPFYLEDQFPPQPFVEPSAPFERIDLFFSKGIQPLSADLLPTPLGSDHAGVLATFAP